MARTYNRDSRGRFSSGGGGGGKAKAKAAPKAAPKAKAAKKAPAEKAPTSTRGKNTARTKELQSKGTTAIGARVKAKGFSGTKATQQKAGGLRVGRQMLPRFKMGGKVIGGKKYVTGKAATGTITKGGAIRRTASRRKAAGAVSTGGRLKGGAAAKMRAEPAGRTMAAKSRTPGTIRRRR